MKKRLLLLFLLHSTFCILHSSAQTNVSGFINANTTWNLAGSPYIVVGNALLSQGYTLTIEPGVVVKFDTMKALQIDGELIAIGTAANRITFTSSSTNPVRGSWAKLHFSAYATDAVYDVNGNYMSGCIMKYCDVLYGGGLGFGEVHVEGSEPYLSQCNIKYSGSAGAYCSGSSYILDSSLVSDNTGYGLYFQIFSQVSCGLVIQGDTIRNNTNGGLYLGNGDPDCITKVLNNYFISNSSNGAIQLDATWANIYIQNNYILNNVSSLSAVVAIDNSGYYTKVRIEENIFSGNSGLNGIIWISDKSEDVNIIRNDFQNNTGFHGLIYAPYEIVNDTIACNRFINNQTSRPVLNLGYTMYANGIIINHNLFDGNNCNVMFQASILDFIQQIRKVDFSYNTIKNNTVNNGKICSIIADVNNTTQNIRIHHNEFSNNSAAKVLFIRGPQISNSVPDFCYLKHNNFSNPSAQYEIYDSIPYGSPNIKADSNYWGTTNTAQIDSMIYDYFDFANQSVVYYMPILQELEVIDTICPPDIITAVTDIEKEMDGFVIYPNPSNDKFTVSLNDKLNNAELLIYDMTGREVYHEQIQNYKQETINHELKAGLYLVRVQGDGGEGTVQKLIIE